MREGILSVLMGDENVDGADWNATGATALNGKNPLIKQI